MYLILSLQLCSCSNAKTPITNNNPNGSRGIIGSNQGLINPQLYKDGVFVGEGDLKSHGREVATITVEKGKITEVLYQRLDSDGNEILKKCCNEVYRGNTRQRLLRDDIESNIDLLTNEVIKKQTYDVSIPTNNKELLLNWKLAVKRAMEKAKK
jgi:hypothetical protein